MPAESSSSSQMYLTLASGRGSSSDYRKDQLWVVGSAPELALAAQAGIADRLNRPWCMVVRSCWHGPNHEGRWAHQHWKLRKTSCPLCQARGFLELA